MAMNWLSFLTAPVQGVIEIFKKKQDRKANAESAKAKLAQTRQSDQTSVTLTDAEGEALLSNSLTTSWKDEYVTVIMTGPILLIIVGAAYFLFTGNSAMMDAGLLAIDKLNAAGVDMALLMNAVVLSAIGLKIWRKS